MLDFVYELQASNDGISYMEIQKRFGVSRRTAERMMKAIRDSDFDSVIVSRRPFRMRLNRSVPTPKLNVEHVSTLQVARQMFDQAGMTTYSAQIKNISWNLRTNMTQQARARIDADADALLESEAFAFNPGPREQIRSEIVSTLRQSILACEVVRFTYVGRTKPKPRTVEVEPYGFLHGLRQYLIAYSPASEDYRTYVLSRISDLEVVEYGYFTRDPDFSFENYLGDSFGVFREKPVNVVWQFDPGVAEDVLEWSFHPTQRMRRMRDGRIEVKFRSGGIDEMAWHVVTWGKAVKVVKPKRLINKLREIKEAMP